MLDGQKAVLLSEEGKPGLVGEQAMKGIEGKTRSFFHTRQWLLNMRLPGHHCIQKS